ncbi:hypothetical protein AN958_10111 [Leucoagaricus sp. SymC.cos]|nr:hypothetical protein AN958_10111 [Leucoagaricus sp. SymC.cos]
MPGQSTAADSQLPQWWDIETEWIGFVPMQPVLYEGAWFRPLNSLPDMVHALPTGQYQLNKAWISVWTCIEETLITVVHTLKKKNAFRCLMPFAPEEWKYDAIHHTEEAALMHIKNGRDWFAMWIGLLYWMTRKSINPASFVEGISAPTWFIQLVQELPLQQAIWDLVWTVPLLQRSMRWNQVGVWLHHLADVNEQPSTQWFVDQHIPVWYRWGHREDQSNQNPFFALISSSAKERQSATTLIFSMLLMYLPVDVVPLNTPHDTSHLDPNSKDIDVWKTVIAMAKKIWDTFWEKRKATHERMLKEETPMKREVRQNHERNKPHKSVKVYEWGWNTETLPKFVKELVRIADQEETLAEHENLIEVYNSFFNEWHCTAKFQDTWVVEDTTAPVCLRALSPDLLSSDVSSSLVPYKHMASSTKEFKQERTQLEVVCLLSRFFGFVPPIPMHDNSTAVTTDADKKCLVAILGLDASTVSNEFLLSPLGKTCQLFLKMFYSRDLESKPEADLWDLSDDNCQTLAFLKRVSAIRTVKCSLGQTWYMFDFGNLCTTPWNLAVQSAAAALFICHLDDTMEEEEVALELA